MHISLSIPAEFTVTNHGYGVISQQIVASLQRLGHRVTFRDPTAPVELCIGQPYHWIWSSRDSHKIGLVAWESTVIPDKWKKRIGSCDELWTPSPVIAEWFEAEGYPAKVYEHGVDAEMWRPKLRNRYDSVKFLHIGEPAPRKGGQMVYDAFTELFGSDPSARLTIKSFGRHSIKQPSNHKPDRENVRVIREEVPEESLVRIVHGHDVLVYPSFGEGFGLIPLQAMATGMPVVCTEAWAPYRDLLIPDLRVKSTLGRSPWSFHTGKMFHPDKDDLRSRMKFAYDNIGSLAPQAYKLSPFVTKRYDWDRLTEKAFAPVVERFES
jgi:glycosyltransferase involved in cell wall biosynthesis